MLYNNDAAAGMSTYRPRNWVCFTLHAIIMMPITMSATATIKGKIDSVKNPLGGKIRADEIGEVILERDLLEQLAGFSETEIVS